MNLNDPMLFRKYATLADTRRDKGLTIPKNIKIYKDIRYGIYDKWNLLDIYHKKDVNNIQPTIISVHGGGWVYGDKELYKFYCMDLSQRGFTVVNFSYRLAPENKYPSALEDINNVFKFVANNAKEYNIDLNNLFVVGDSAGAQLASQYLAILTNEKFQKLFDFKVPKDTIKIKASALNCGIYEVKDEILSSQDGLVKAYLGDNPISKLESVDIIKYITKNFPPTFVMTAYHDFLREHAKPMYDTLQKLDIQCKYKIYGNKDDEKISHVFHLNIRLNEAKLCNDEECKFFKNFIDI